MTKFFTKIFLIGLLLIISFGFAGKTFAATGDITAVRIIKDTCSVGITCNGWVAEIDITGLATGGTYNFGMGTNNDPTNAKIVFTLTSHGYDTSGNATTITRTIYGTQWLRKAYPNNAVADETLSGGTLTVRVGLSDFIYSGDTSITANIASGFYTGSNAVTGISVTNNSTQAYPQTVGRWATVAYQKVTGNFQVEAVAFNRFAQNGKPVAAVSFTCSDQHSNTTAPVVVNSMTVSTQPGDQHAVLVYAATIPVSSLTQGDVLTCNFKAYPWVGDAGSVLDSSSTTGAIGVTSVNAGGSGYAVNDTGIVNGGDGNATYKVLTVSSGAVATFTITYAGTGYSTATGATTATGGAQAGSGSGFTMNTTVYRGMAGHESLGPLMMLNDKSGTYGASYAVVDPTNGHASALATWVTATQSAAESAYTSSTANSYTTIGFAAQALKAYNNTNYSRNEPGNGTILLATNTNAYPGTSPGSTLGVQNTWMTITTISSGGGAITSGAISTLNAQRVKFSGITISGNTNGEIYSGNTNTDIMWTDNCTLNMSGANNFYAWELGYATRNSVTALVAGFKGGGTAATKFPWILVRGNSASSASAGVGIPATQYAILGNNNITPTYQSTATVFTTQPSDNSVVAYNTFYNYTGSVITNDDTSPVTAGIAIVQNIIEDSTAATNPSMRIFENSNANQSNVLLWHNTAVGSRIDQAYNYTGSPAPGQLYMWNWSHIGNIYENYNYNGDTSAPVNATHYGNMAVDYAVGQKGNYKRTSAGETSPGTGSFLGVFNGLYSTYSGDTTMGFINDAAFNDRSEGGSGLGNGDYHLTASSPALNLIASGQSLLPFDIAGVARKNDGTGSAGAYEYIPPVTDISAAGVTGFTAPATGGTPQVFGNLTAGSAQYTVTGLTWSPTDNPFHAATAYTATVVLTSAATYKFPTGGIAVPTANGGGTVSAGTTSGGDVSGNTLTFTVLFPSTAAKTTPTLSISNSPVTYNASPQAATVSGSVAGVVSNIQYNGSGTTPTNAGTYAITADFAPTDSANYNSLTGASAGNFTINTANQGTLTAISTPSTVPYGTTATLSSSGGSGTGAVTFSVGASTGCNITGGTTLNVSNPAGTCTVTATKVTDTNYNSATSAGLSVTLTKGTQATLTVTGLPASAVYQEAGITAGTSGGSGTGAVTFSAGVSTACSINSSSGAVTITASSGTCLITATKATDTNYNSATSGSVSIAVGTAPQTITVTTPAPGSATYNGTFPVAATSNSGLTVAITTTGGCSISGGTVTMTSGTTACTVHYNQTGDSNYSTATEVTSVTTAVLANQSTLTAISTPSTVPYGTTATLSSSGGSGTGAVTFSVGASTGCNITGGTTLNVSNASGTCTVTATKAADTNYNSASSAGLSVTLTKTTQSTLTFAGQTVTYATTFSTLSTTDGSGTGVVTYAVTTAGTAGCSIVGTTLSYTTAGTCGVTATKAADSNYNSVSSSEATFTINAPTAHIITVTSGSNGTITPGTTSVNNGSDQAFTITPNSGYHIDTVTTDSVAVSATSPYIFTNVTVDHTISATFAADAVVVTGGGPLVSGGNGAPVGLINGSGSRRQDVSNILAPTIPATSTTTIISGCKNGTNGFSTTTGQSCLGNTGGTTTSTLPKYNFTRNLSLHVTGKDVKALQQFLNANGFVISKTGAGSPGKETTLFGTLTYKALVKFQKSIGWSGTGFFGPMTREYIASH